MVHTYLKVLFMEKCSIKRDKSRAGDDDNLVEIIYSQFCVIYE